MLVNQGPHRTTTREQLSTTSVPPVRCRRDEESMRFRFDARGGFVGVDGVGSEGEAKRSGAAVCLGLVTGDRISNLLRKSSELVSPIQASYRPNAFHRQFQKATKAEPSYATRNIRFELDNVPSLSSAATDILSILAIIRGTYLLTWGISPLSNSESSACDMRISMTGALWGIRCRPMLGKA